MTLPMLWFPATVPTKMLQFKAFDSKLKRFQLFKKWSPNIEDVIK